MRKTIELNPFLPKFILSRYVCVIDDNMTAEKPRTETKEVGEEEKIEYPDVPEMESIEEELRRRMDEIREEHRMEV